MNEHWLTDWVKFIFPSAWYRLYEIYWKTYSDGLLSGARECWSDLRGQVFYLPSGLIDFFCFSKRYCQTCYESSLPPHERPTRNSRPIPHDSFSIWQNRISLSWKSRFYWHLEHQTLLNDNVLKVFSLLKNQTVMSFGAVSLQVSLRLLEKKMDCIVHQPTIW